MSDLVTIILAAGKGTRMKSKLPKVLHKAAGKAMLQHVIDAAREAGADRNIVVTGFGGDMVREAMGEQAGVEYVTQAEQLGTGHAVLQAREKLEGVRGTVMVLCGDTPLLTGALLKNLYEAHKEAKAKATVLTAIMPDATGYGRIIRGEDGSVLKIVEHKDASEEERQVKEVNSGIYCFDIEAMFGALAKVTNDNAQGEYYLTDMVGIYRQIGEPVSALLAEDDSELLGVNSRVQLAQVTKIMQERINGQLMAEGVTMLDPSMVWVGPEVTVDRDTELLPMTMLWGKTSIGSDCVIGPNTRLTNVTVGDGSSVEETVGYDTVIDQDVTVGPRAYLRPGTHLCDRAHVGTHVEIKNSTIGEGSKVPHLSYIGDTSMGSGVNIGAGSITCNYDGVNKHRTTIGNDVFIGSDTMMVAPVSIGDGALVGASSCITSDVPADALALERSDQQVIEGYAKVRRERLHKEK